MVAGIELTREPPVFTLRMARGRNEIDRELLDGVAAALDEIEACEPAALVLTGAGRYFSTGFDLAALSRGPRDAARGIVDDAVRLLGRLLVSPVPSVAAVNGHAFGISAMIALACDYRTMRADRGFFCLPEVDRGTPISAGMAALLSLRLAPPVLRDALLTGERYGGREAARRGLVDEAVDEGAVLAAAAARAAALAEKDRRTFASLKCRLHAAAIAAIDAETR